MSTQVNKIYEQMGNKISILRKEKQMTQKELSMMLGVSTPYIAHIEQGRRGGSNELLLKAEEIFQLEKNTLLHLRDGTSLDHSQEPKVKSPSHVLPDTIQLLMTTLLSCEENYVLQKIPKWLKELKDDLFNQLTAYELTDIKEHVMTIAKQWIDQSKNREELEANSRIMEGYITQDEQKHFFSLQLNSHAVTLSLLDKDQQTIQHFEEWLGTYSTSYSTPQQLPYFEKEEVVSYFIWFNPQVSITDMYKYLNNLPVHFKEMKINEPRLNWYIQELI